MAKLKYYQELAKSILDDDERKDRKELFDKIDTAILGGNDLSVINPELDALPWMVQYKSSVIHDAYAAARKTMSSSRLTINVMPPFSNPMNLQVAKDIEAVLEYNFWLTNRKSSKRPMTKIADHASRYLGVCIEVIDNEFQYKGQKGARVSAVRRSGRFTWAVIDPREAHPRYSDSILEAILLTRIVSVQDLVDKFGKEATAEIVADTKEENKNVDLRETTGTLFTYYDYDVRVEWFSMNGDEMDYSGGVDGYEIMNEKNKLGFIPFVCLYEDDPILKAAIDTDQLDNLNILLSMRYALIAATVAQARTVSRTASGEGIPIDYTNPAAQAQAKLNEDLTVLPPPQTDPNLNAVIAAGQQDIAGSTSVSRILSSMDSMASNTPYSTISSLMQSALQSLIEIRNLCERVVEEALCIELYWVKYSDNPLYGQRMKKVGLYDDTKMLGAQLKIDPEQGDDFPDRWIITAKLQPNSPTDRQERLNFAINAQEKLLISRASAFEIAGIEEDPETALLEYGDDQEKLAEIQANVKRIVMKPDLEMAQAQMEMQMQAQQQMQQPMAQEEQMMAQDPSMGQTPATGGVPPAIGNPYATRETITGQSAQMTNGGG